MIILFFLFELKHFICDGLLQTRYHLGKFEPKFRQYAMPLLSHAAINAVGAALIALAYNYKVAFYICVLEIILHFIIDRVKASPKILGRWQYHQPWFWHVLMFDQMLHRLTYMFYVYLILKV